MPDAGIGKTSPTSLSTTTAISCFIAISFYNVIELVYIIFATFKKRGGLYFWSFLVSTCGIGLYGIGFLLKDVESSIQSSIYVTFIAFGWPAMVTGQSVVLYSRLHLVMQIPSRLRLVLIMIILNAAICHIPILVMVYGANSNNPTPFLLPYSIYEKVQVTIFFLQELIISSLYISQTVKILRPEGNVRGRASRQVMIHLIYVNVIIVFLDLTILGLEYSGLYDIQTAYKGLVYSAKLKLEFSILNRLVDLIKNGELLSQVSERSRIHLETFDDGRLKADGRGLGYKAHILSAGAREAVEEEETVQGDNAVVMTTQISVQRDDDRTVRDGEEDLNSISESSTGNAIEGENAVVTGSSSQVCFAQGGF